jgi:hypothetical protein
MTALDMVIAAWLGVTVVGLVATIVLLRRAAGGYRYDRGVVARMTLRRQLIKLAKNVTCLAVGGVAAIGPNRMVTLGGLILLVAFITADSIWDVLDENRLNRDFDRRAAARRADPSYTGPRRRRDD